MGGQDGKNRLKNALQNFRRPVVSWFGDPCGADQSAHLWGRKGRVGTDFGCSSSLCIDATVGPPPAPAGYLAHRLF